MDELLDEALRSEGTAWSEAMREPDEVQAMLGLAASGVGARRIAELLGCSRNTVRRYLRQGGWRPLQAPTRSGRLDAYQPWLAERFRQHRGNCDVLRQALWREHGIAVSLRTVQRAVAHLRGEVFSQAVATIRYETPPGHQLQIDFGTVRVTIADELVRVHLFVATLGYSRRIYVEAFADERRASWLRGIEGAFAHFGGVPRELLLDNARALVDEHDAATREVKFNERFRAFCHHWHVTPRACAPYRARTKGKDERGVGYVKRNAIAGHVFPSLAALHAHLACWMREVADVRVHGTIGEMPISRFEREERALRQPLEGRPPFLQARELLRRVHTDACIELDTNRYSVPWRLIGERVTVLVAERQVSIRHAGMEVALHPQSEARRTQQIDRRHLEGIVGAHLVGSEVQRRLQPAAAPGALLRPLQEYERLLGGAW